MRTVVFEAGRGVRVLFLHVAANERRIHLIHKTPSTTSSHSHLQVQFDDGSEGTVNMLYGPAGFETTQPYTPVSGLLRTWTLDAASAGIILPVRDSQFRAGHPALNIPVTSETQALAKAVRTHIRRVAAEVVTDLGTVELAGTLIGNPRSATSRIFLPDASLSAQDHTVLGGVWQSTESRKPALPVAGSRRYETINVNSPLRTTTGIHDLNTGLIYIGGQLMCSDDAEPDRPILATLKKSVSFVGEELVMHLLPHPALPRRVRTLVNDPVRPAIYGSAVLPDHASIRARVVAGNARSLGLFHVTAPDVTLNASTTSRSASSPVVAWIPHPGGEVIVRLTETNYSGRAEIDSDQATLLANLLNRPLDFSQARAATSADIEDWTAELRRSGRGHLSPRPIQTLDGAPLSLLARMHPLLPNVLLILHGAVTYASHVRCIGGTFTATLELSSGKTSKPLNLITLDPALRVWFSDYHKVQTNRWRFAHPPLRGSLLPAQLAILEAKA